MSRTYRRAMLNLDRDDKPFIPRKYSFYHSEGEYWEHCHTDYYSKRNQKFDCKPWNKSSSDYKKTMQRQRRAKERQALKNGNYENIPRFKKENDWNWV